MKVVGGKQVLIGCMGFFVLGGLFFKTQMVNLDFYTVSVRLLRHIEQQDAGLNEGILRIKARHLLNYDSVVAGMRALIKDQSLLARELAAAGTIIDADSVRTLTLGLDALKHTLSYKALLLEDFKSQNAILSNSLAYLSEHTNLLTDIAKRKSTGNTDEGLFTMLIMDALHYALVPQSYASQRIEKALGLIRLRMPSYSGRDQQHIAQVLGHVRLILDNQSRVNSLVGRLITVPVAQRLHQLTGIYERHHSVELAKTNTYRLYLYITAIAMLFYIAYVLIRLKAGTEALDTAVQELKFQQFAMDQHAIVSIANVKGEITYVNDKFLETSQYEAQELLGCDHRIVNSGYHSQSFFRELWTTISSGEVWRGEIRNRRKDGRCYWVDCTIVPFKNETGIPYKYVSIRSDITERKQVQEALFHEKERAQITLASIGEGVAALDTSGRITYLNPKAEALIGCTLEEADSRSLEAVFVVRMDEKDRIFADLVNACLQQGRAVVVPGNPALTSRNGASFFVEITIAPLCDRNNEVIGAVLVFRDVTELRAMARKITHQATHDSLTGLVNRVEFERRLRKTVSGVRQNREHHALCYIDLDQFKVVNDTCGHAAGDELLRQLATLLHAKIRAGDVIGRLGGDEFGVLLEHCQIERAEQIGYEMCRLVKDFRYVWKDKTFQVGASIGIVPINVDSGAIENILTMADTACYMAKDLGRNRVHVYHDDDIELQAKSDEMHWVPRIAKALSEDRFCLYAQAILPIVQKSLIPHYEVLIRMLDESGELVPPGAFFSAAERYDLMPAIDRWVISNSFAVYSQFIRSRPGDSWPRCTINLSGASLNEAQFGRFIREQLALYQVPPRLVCFEITETVAITNLVRVIEFMRDLKGLGCQFALDDFGSGLSSFAYLKNLPVDYLKIDGNFVRDIAKNPIDRAMVGSIHQIGHVMGLKTIAEFVEDKQTLAVLEDIGVDYAQGFGVSRPQAITKYFGSQQQHRLSLVAG